MSDLADKLLIKLEQAIDELDLQVTTHKIKTERANTEETTEFRVAVPGGMVDRAGLRQLTGALKEIKIIKDTLASLRLDSVISSGFRIGRSLAAQYIAAGKVAVNGLPCEKPDKSIEEGASIAVRGLGKIKLTSVNGQTKKGRISVVIDRYV